MQKRLKEMTGRAKGIAGNADMPTLDNLKKPLFSKKTGFIKSGNGD